jgi:limonene-1,2-epoxide hydrolase
VNHPQQTGAEIIREFINCWASLDAAALAAYFSVDGVYHNMPSAPVAGRDNIQRFIGGFAANWTSTDWQILNIVEQGNIVIAERVDRTQLGDKAINLPCCGVFEMQDGKIKVWRDYFDLNTYMQGLP